MLPTVFLMPYNAHLPISMAFRHASSTMFALFQLDITRDGGTAIQVGGLILPYTPCTLGSSCHFVCFPALVYAPPMLAPPPTPLSVNPETFLNKPSSVSASPIPNIMWCLHPIHP